MAALNTVSAVRAGRWAISPKVKLLNGIELQSWGAFP
jgi:hypothetical protein